MISVHHRNNQSGAIVESLTDGYGAGRLVPPAGTGAAIESRRFFEPHPRAVLTGARSNAAA